MSNIQNLLHRYQEGTITPDELDELNRLTHRDQVLQSANRQAAAIHRRRRNTVVGVAAVLLVVGVVFYVSPNATDALSDMPTVAQADVPSVTPADTPTDNYSETQSDVEKNNTVVRQSEPIREEEHHPKPALVASEPVQQLDNPTPPPVEKVPVETFGTVESLAAHPSDPIVACNTQCSPDSVINGIWKFLRT